MSEINLDQKSALSAFAEKLRATEGETQAEVPVEANKAAPESTETPDKPEAEEELKEQPKAEETPKEEPQSWDADLEIEQPKEQTSTFDFKSLGSALELGDVKDESELKAKISEFKTRVKQLEEAPYEGISEDLKTFVDIARKSGDEEAKSFLANQLVDYSKVDPLQLFEDEFYRDAASNPRYTKDGKIDWDSVDAAYDTLPDTLKEFQGKQLQYAKHQLQLQKRQEIVAKAEARSQAASKSLMEASKNLNDILPLDKFGIKFEPKHSAQIFEGVTSSKLTKKHLGVSYETLVKSGADMKAITATITKAEYAEQMLKFKSNNSKVEAKKELLDKTQNARIVTPGSTVDPNSEAKKEKSIGEKMAAYKASLNQPGRL
jgi:hypothetical protein